jgi:hypothetical protein
MRRVSVAFALSLMASSGCGQSADVATDADRSSGVEAKSSSATPSTPAAAPSTATPTADPLLADQVLVRSLYYNYSQTSGQGLMALAEFRAANSHPRTRYSANECLDQMQYSWGATDSYSISNVPDIASMALDPGWAVPSGRFQGVIPEGRTYILALEISETDVGYSDAHTNQVHVSVLDGVAYYFQNCESA